MLNGSGRAERAKAQRWSAEGAQQRLGTVQAEASAQCQSQLADHCALGALRRRTTSASPRSPPFAALFVRVAEASPTDQVTLTLSASTLLLLALPECSASPSPPRRWPVEPQPVCEKECHRSSSTSSSSRCAERRAQPPLPPCTATHRHRVIRRLSRLKQRRLSNDLTLQTPLQCRDQPQPHSHSPHRPLQSPSSLHPLPLLLHPPPPLPRVGSNLEPSCIACQVLLRKVPTDWRSNSSFLKSSRIRA